MYNDEAREQFFSNNDVFLNDFCGDITRSVLTKKGVLFSKSNRSWVAFWAKEDWGILYFSMIFIIWIKKTTPGFNQLIKILNR